MNIMYKITLYMLISIVCLTNHHIVVYGQEDIPGTCPEVKQGWDQEKKGKLDLKRLSGTWLNAYDHT